MVKIEIRKLISDAYKNGKRISELVEIFQIPERTICGLLKHERETGSMEPSNQNCGRPPALTNAELEEMKKIVEGQNDITLEELKEKMHLSICISAISRILRFKLGFNYKKKRWSRQSETVRKTSAGGKNS